MSIFRLRILFFLLFLISLVSCKQKKPLPTSFDIYKQVIDSLKEVKLSSENWDFVMTQWRELEKSDFVEHDSVLSARVKYNIGRIYAIFHNSDSGQMYIEQALELIEPVQGNLEYKAFIYGGLGNIWNAKMKEHQANYFYNKAATIVLSDSTLDMPPLKKAIILVAAAQSNNNLYHYSLARQMNEAALALSPFLPPDNINRQRPLTQMIQTLDDQGFPADSMKVYLDSLESLHNQYPQSFDLKFLYECKYIYYEKLGNQDSILHYQLLKCKLDESKYENNKGEAIATNNLYLAYLTLIGTYVNQNNIALAEEAQKKAIGVYDANKEIIALENLMQYNYNVAELFKLKGDPRTSYTFLQKAFEQQRQNYQSENIQAIAEMNALAQIHSKDKSILELNESIKVNSLQLQKNQLYLVIAILSLVLLGGGFINFYNGYRRRKTRQEQEEVLLHQQLLRTQMELHFIFNTLAAVQSFVRFDEKDKAIKYLNRFSRLLRSSLELSREQKVSLSDEVEALENYLGLQQMRFENGFKYDLILQEDAELESIMLPPMLVQPFVENAIIHGLNMGADNCFLSVDFAIKDSLLEVKIIDSGNSNQTKSAHKSLSGTISRERMQLLGKAASIHSETNEFGGTTVILNIPLD